MIIHFLEIDRPEVIVEFGERIELSRETMPYDRKELTHMLERSMEKVCDNQAYEISHGDITKYNILFKQHLKWYRRIEQRLKSIDLPQVADV